MKSFFVRNMLLNYDKQLINARRLARYRRSLQGPGGDDVTISREAKRHQMVERVAREIVENLIITGTDNPIVNEIKDQLRQDYKNDLKFKYPPNEEDLQIFMETAQGPVEVKNSDKTQVLNRLWQITLDKVNETML